MNIQNRFNSNLINLKSVNEIKKDIIETTDSSGEELEVLKDKPVQESTSGVKPTNEQILAAKGLVIGKNSRGPMVPLSTKGATLASDVADEVKEEEVGEVKDDAEKKAEEYNKMLEQKEKENLKSNAIIYGAGTLGAAIGSVFGPVGSSVGLVIGLGVGVITNFIRGIFGRKKG